jgi:geranylgeranyl diphosphate synthase type II
MTAEGYLAERSRWVDEALFVWASEAASRVEPRLLESMRYSLFSGGKRIRPALLLAAAEAAGRESRPLLPFACALEMVHTYSLIHDDLPAMDDDPVRRGKPSNHVVFGEGIAILAGDALLTEAFALMSGPAARAAAPADTIVRAIAELATASGAEGMVGGQTADLLAEGEMPDFARVESIHRRKTGALLRAAVRMGGLLGGADERRLEALTRYGEALGLAFQVADDLLDEIGAIEATGKQGPRDRERGKATVPAALGVEASRKLLQRLRDDALAALEPLGPRAEPLAELVRFVAGRAL